MLIADATDPILHTLLAEIGPWARERWVPALLVRLESSPALPVDGGYSTDGPAGELTNTLGHPQVPIRQHGRIQQVLAERGYSQFSRYRSGFF